MPKRFDLNRDHFYRVKVVKRDVNFADYMACTRVDKTRVHTHISDLQSEKRAELVLRLGEMLKNGGCYVTAVNLNQGFLDFQASARSLHLPQGMDVIEKQRSREEQ